MAFVGAFAAVIVVLAYVTLCYTPERCGYALISDDSRWAHGVVPVFCSAGCPRVTKHSPAKMTE